MNLGIYAASVTPFTPKNTINADSLLQLMERNLNEGAAGFFIGGSSGEFLLLTFQERVRLFEIAATYARKTDLIAHVGALSTQKAIDYAKAAKKYGFNRIAAIPPIYYGFTNKEICDYYYEISTAVEMPIIIYNFPANTKREIDLRDENYATLLKSSAIEGIKHTNQVIYQMERLMQWNPRLKFWNGFDETMIAGMALGATGSIGSTFNFMLPHYKKIFDAFTTGQIEKARKMQYKANNIMETLVNIGLIPSIKYILTIQGIDVGSARRPFSPLDEEQKSKINTVLEKNLIV